MNEMFIEKKKLAIGDNVVSAIEEFNLNVSNQLLFQK
jgi:hypothetical protein